MIMITLINNYFSHLKERLKYFQYGIMVILLSFSGGYMVADFPQKFLQLFTSPLAQFMIFFAIFFTKNADDPQTQRHIFTIVADSMLATISLQIFKLIVFHIFQSTLYNF